MKISVIGDGGWGTALAIVLQRNGHEVSVWGPFADYTATVNQQHENVKFLPGVPLSEELTFCSDCEQVTREVETIVLAMPSKFYRSVLTQFFGMIPPGTPTVSVSKGFDEETGLRLSETAERLLPGVSVAALSGPSHAEEVARGIPSAVAVAAKDEHTAQTVQHLFNSDSFRVYTSPDRIGLELGGALKNVMALAAGVSDGIGFGDNSKAALMTRGLAEMKRFGVAFGAHPETFMGLSGMGDLIVTCASRHSRNRGVGERLGRGEKLADIMDSMSMVAEGVWTCGTAKELAAKHHIDVPIIDEVWQILHEDKDPRQAVQDLMSREPRPECD